MSMLRRSTAAVLVLLGGCAALPEGSAPGQPPAVPTLAERLQDATERMFASRAVGVAWVWMEDGEIIAEGYRGLARQEGDPGGAVPVTADTPFHIASSSKPVTAAALLMAMGDRGLSLDEPFVPYLGGRIAGTAAEFGEVSFRQLLNHTSGLPFGYASPPLEESLGPLLERAPEPGAIGKRTYSNLNYAVARMLVEELSGSDYESFVREHVVAKTAETWDVDFAADRVTLAYRFGRESVPGARWEGSFVGEAGPYGWHTTARSLAAFGDALACGELLPPDGTEAMLSEGVGFGKFRSRNGTYAGHHGQWTMGGNAGYESAICVFPGKVTAVVLTNSTRALFDPVDALRTIYEAFLPDVRRTTAADDPQQPVLSATFFDPDCTLHWSRGGAVTANSALVEATLPVTPGDKVRVRAFVGRHAASFTRIEEVEPYVAMPADSDEAIDP